MFTIKATPNFQPLRRLIDGSAKQIPFATALTLTRLAQISKQELQTEMRRVFERPTRFAINSIFIRPATKQRLVSEVWLKGEYPGDPAQSFMRPQIFGGTRPQKKFERMLERARVLPPGWVTVPGKGAKIDSFGNQSPAEIVQILSALSAFPQGGVGFSANRTDRSRGRRKGKLRDIFFSGPNLQQRAANGGRLPWGVWERKGRRVQALLFFVRKAQYRKRLAFFEVCQRVATRESERQFDIAMRRALATAF
jgi:hypothetical protein